MHSCKIVDVYVYTDCLIDTDVGWWYIQISVSDWALKNKSLTYSQYIEREAVADSQHKNKTILKTEAYTYLKGSTTSTQPKIKRDTQYRSLHLFKG